MNQHGKSIAITNNLTLRFPQETINFLQLDANKTSLFELAAKMTLAVGDKIDPTNALKWFNFWRVAKNAADGFAAGNKDWIMAASLSGLNYYFDHLSMQPTLESKSWIGCLLYQYMVRYKPLKENTTSIEAYGFGFMLNIKDLMGISRLDDIFYPPDIEGKRPSILFETRPYFEFLNQYDQVAKDEDAEDDGFVEILIDEKGNVETYE